MDNDDISQLSDPEGEENQVSTSPNPKSSRGKSSKANKTQKKAEEYKLTNTLKVPRATTYAASALNGITLSVASLVFMTGVIPHRDVETGQQYWFCKNSKQKGDLLPEKFRTIFSNKQIVCVEYQDLKDTDERDIFTRVQLGMALTVAEKLQAVSTPRAHLIRHLIQSFITPETLAHPDIPWDRARARDFQIIGTALFCLCKWDKHLGLKTWVSMGMLEKWLAESRKTKKSGPRKDTNEGSGLQLGVPVDEDFKALVVKTFEIVVKLATTPRASKTMGLKVSPIEMVGAFILVYVVQTNPPKAAKHEMTLAALSALFVLLRKKLREEHEDVRSNGRVGRTMFDFCLDASKDPLGTLTEGEEAGLLEGEVEDGARWTKSKRSGNRKPDVTTKRKNQPRDDSESSEEEQRGQGSRYEEEEATVPAKRRRSTGRLSTLGRGSPPESPKRRKSEPASKREGVSRAEGDKSRGVKTKRKSVLSHVALPASTPSPHRLKSSSPTTEAYRKPRSRKPESSISRAMDSSPLTPVSPEASPHFAIPSPLRSSSPGPSTDMLVEPDSSSQALEGRLQPPVISQASPVLSPEQLLAAMGVPVPPDMIPLMMTQMKLFAQGGMQALPRPPSPTSSQTATLSVPSQEAEDAVVKDEGTGARDGSQGLFAANLAQGIQGGSVHVEE
ncbi:hypothetical protein V5O48_001482 [Marasmius crinis-equi]|uniref:Uncharacterized protein n=1 Tax=Marasmius crinis-equi TaxID=585013 RepID=A0ABR3FYG8_9AGAR